MITILIHKLHRQQVHLRVHQRVRQQVHQRVHQQVRQRVHHLLIKLIVPHLGFNHHQQEVDHHFLHMFNTRPNMFSYHLLWLKWGWGYLERFRGNHRCLHINPNMRKRIIYRNQRWFIRIRFVCKYWYILSNLRRNWQYPIYWEELHIISRNYIHQNRNHLQIRYNS